MREYILDPKVENLCKITVKTEPPHKILAGKALVLKHNQELKIHS